MKQGAYWVNCSPAHIHDLLHGNRSMCVSHMKTHTAVKLTDGGVSGGLGRAVGGTQRGYLAYKLVNKPPSGLHSLYFSLRLHGSGSKPPFMCGYPSKACGILLSNSKMFPALCFEVGPTRKVQLYEQVNHNIIIHI